MDIKFDDEKMAESCSEWGKVQDDYLQNLVEKHGDNDWKKIAELMNEQFPIAKRTPKDCYNQWKFIATGGKESWDEQERYLLLIAHQKYKNRWAEIAHILHKQSRNFIKNRFYTLFRKIRNRIKNGDVYITSLLDLLEIYYIINLIEQYGLLPAGKFALEKNYAHKLVQRTDRSKVAEYKARIIELYKTKGTMEELFEKCASLYCPQGQFGLNSEQIQLNENEEETKKIKLPYPGTFLSSERITAEEKDLFWKSAFLNKEPRSAQIDLNSVASSYVSSAISQISSAGPMAMRDDEGYGFTQFINTVEPKPQGDPKLSNFMPGNYWKDGSSNNINNQPLPPPNFSRFGAENLQLPRLPLGSSIPPPTDNDFQWFSVNSINLDKSNL